VTDPDAAASASGPPTVDPATLDFLRWISERTATYDEAWEVWQTMCPRQSTWEDSFIEGFVRSERPPGTIHPIVVLTPLGRSIIDSSGNELAIRSEE
jgi:hypothetical protein